MNPEFHTQQNRLSSKKQRLSDKQNERNISPTYIIRNVKGISSGEGKMLPKGNVDHTKE